jgi:hypothetical protein
MNDVRFALAEPYRAARELLGVLAGATPREVKRAYRRMAIAHPPDRDPEGFTRLRDAYELLSQPGPRAKELLEQKVPAVPPPPVVLPRVERGATAVAVLRMLAGRWDTDALLADLAVEQTQTVPAAGAAESS